MNASGVLDTCKSNGSSQSVRLRERLEDEKSLEAVEGAEAAVPGQWRTGE